MKLLTIAAAVLAITSPGTTREEINRVTVSPQGTNLILPGQAAGEMLQVVRYQQRQVRKRVWAAMMDKQVPEQHHIRLIHLDLQVDFRIGALEYSVRHGGATADQISDDAGLIIGYLNEMDMLIMPETQGETQ